MADVVDLSSFAAERRKRREAFEHARALVLFECAAALARQDDPDLFALVRRHFGAEWFDARVKETLTPRAKTAAPLHQRTRRSPR